MTLWTQSMLVAARGIYQAAGFTLVQKSRIAASASIWSARPGSAICE